MERKLHDCNENFNLPPWCSRKSYEQNVCSVNTFEPILFPNQPEDFADRNGCKKIFYKNKICNGAKRTPRIKRKPIIKTASKSRKLLKSFMIMSVCLVCIGSSYWILESGYLSETNSILLWFKLPYQEVPSSCRFWIKQLTVDQLRAERTFKKSAMNRAIRTHEASYLGNRKNCDEIIESKTPIVRIDIDGQVTVGARTKEWAGARATLWGVVPLPRTTPSPYIILDSRKPSLGDCWPFIGSRGEVRIELTHSQQIHSVSIEHIRPDSVHSAPKNFSIYGISENGTWILVLKAAYRNEGAAQQFYKINLKTPLKEVVFRVLSNHGNNKYTCVYRFHLYGDTNTYFS